MAGDFGPTLRRYRLRAGLSQSALAKVAGIYASYINRLESGEREAPTREVARALARALALAPEETDRLLFCAGHVPPGLQKLGPADSTVAAVTRLLTDDRLPPEARADFRACVEAMAMRWAAACAVVPRPLGATDARSARPGSGPLVPPTGTGRRASPREASARRPCGDRHQAVRLSSAQVEKIRALHPDPLSTVGAAATARLLGVSRGAVAGVITGKNRGGR